MSRPAPTTGPPQLPGLVYVQPLGSGGYADVYLYEQQSPRMPVAVKVLRAEGLTDALRRRFAEEADTMAQLGDHPYIVQIFRAGTSPDGRPYLVMKYYPPPNLARRARLQPLTVDEVLRTGVQLASAVETAHQAGVVHRDIKPANVLVSSYGAPGLTDFGIAGRGGASPSGANGPEREAEPTDVGVSVPWAPPEVLYAEGEGTERGDVYSLAATLWQLLVGRSPFEVPGGDNTAYALMPRIRGLPVPPTGRPDVPASLERVLAQAMAKDPARRPARMVELARQLQAVEQELRLPRTPLVVLDQPDQDGHPDQQGQQGQQAGDDDRTRVKNVQQVRAQSSGAFAPTPDTLAAPAARDRSGRPLVLALALAGVVVLLILVGFLALRDNSGMAATTPTPSRTAVATQSATTDSAIGDGVFSAPVVTATPKVGAVEFAWTYAAPRTTDTYRVHVGPTPADAETNDPVTVPKATYSVKVAGGSSMCLVATVVRAGQISPASPPVCATAL